MSDIGLPPHLTLCDPHNFRVKRTKWGRGFRFCIGQARNIKNEKMLRHLKAIPVPNTWTEVRLSSEPHTYILAVGYDGSEKLQYLYHPDFLTFRNVQKFSRLYDFGMQLPRIRRKVLKHLKQEEWNEQKLMALIVRILDKYHMRIGSRIYVKNGHSFGLTTLRKKHFREVDAAVKFEYMGKSGQFQEVELTDTVLVAMVREIAEMPGWELFSFQQKGLKLQATAGKVNEYIRGIAGEDYSARTFRTWAGTVLAVKYSPRARKILEQNPQRKLRTVVVELVAKELGNTPAICEEYYIHPQVLQAVLKEDFNTEPGDPRFLKKNLFRKYECRALEILSNTTPKMHENK